MTSGSDTRTTSYHIINYKTVLGLCEQDLTDGTLVNLWKSGGDYWLSKFWEEVGREGMLAITWGSGMLMNVSWTCLMVAVAHLLMQGQIVIIE